jgi:sodium/potassium-transporting ATPase subunit alpha
MSDKPAADPPPKSEDENPPVRAVAFPNHDEIEEKPITAMRPKGVDLKREMTKEDKELAAAGYEHLEEHKAKKVDKAAKLDEHVDVQEHRLSFSELEAALKTSINTKEPGASLGLTTEEASERLKRDGRNVLTPPKKKSAFRKVRPCYTRFLVSDIYRSIWTVS